MSSVRRSVLALGLALAGSTALSQEVTLTVDTGQQQIDGLRPAIRAASLVMGLDQTSDAGPQDYVAAARADYRRILTALYSEGFYGGRISILVNGREASGLAPLDAPRPVNTVEIMVQPGPRFTFGRAEIGPLPAGAEMPEAFRTGEIARSDAITAAARAAVTAWREEGHAKAAPDGEQITARHPARELDARVSIAPGPRLTFGPLLVEGNEAVRTARILAIAGLPTGTVFSPAELDAAATRLRRTGAFSSVAIVEEDYRSDLSMPITAQVVEQAPRRIGAGAEISTVDGLALTAFWLHRNLLGGAERFRVEGEVTGIGGQTGGVDYALGATFDRPASFGPLTDLYANARISRVDDPGYFIDQVTAEVGISRQVTDTFSYELGVGVLAAEVEDEFGARDYAFLTFPASATWDTRDEALDATTGQYLNAELTPFLSPGEDTYGGRLYADGRIYRSFGAEDRLTLAARAQLGAVFGVEAEDAPADFLFFSGGGGSVRGQKYQSLGVDIGGDDLVGGRGYAGGQFEVRYDVTERIGAVAFYDVGLVSPDPFDDAGSDWHAGAGLGVRYDTGIGPIRLDLGVPTTGDDAGERVEVYIGIGQSF